MYLVGIRDSHDLQQLFLLGGAICTSHCRSFSSANGSPGCLTSGFYITRKKDVEKNIKYSINIATTVFHSPLRKLHCYQYRAYLTQHLSSPALILAASFSWSHVECPQLDLLKIFNVKFVVKKVSMRLRTREWFTTSSAFIWGRKVDFRTVMAENIRVHRNYESIRRFGKPKISQEFATNHHIYVSPLQ